MIRVTSSDSPPLNRGPSRFKLALKKLNWLFLATVVAPTLIAVAYFGLLASDVYVSESKFVIRSPDRPSTSPLGLILQGAGFSRAQDDSYTVQDFVLSRDALKSINEVLDLGTVFTRPEIDFFNRFAAIDGDTSFEALHRYYEKKINILHDATSSISTLTVRAYTAEDALAINKKLLELSESLINRINDRGRQDLIKSAALEVEEASGKARAAAYAVLQFRNTRSVVDPERQASLQLQQITKLQDELLAAKLQLNQLKVQTPDNSQIRSLQSRVVMLEQEVAKESTKVTGNDRSLANKASEYQRLSLDREFAEKQLASAMTSLEGARNEARRKQVYLERIVQPNMPDHALEPKRFKSILATLLTGLVAWGILSLLLAGVREHNN